MCIFYVFQTKSDYMFISLFISCKVAMFHSLHYLFAKTTIVCIAFDYILIVFVSDVIIPPPP